MSWAGSRTCSPRSRIIWGKRRAFPYTRSRWGSLKALPGHCRMSRSWSGKESVKRCSPAEMPWPYLHNLAVIHHRPLGVEILRYPRAGGVDKAFDEGKIVQLHPVEGVGEQQVETLFRVPVPELHRLGKVVLA